MWRRGARLPAAPPEPRSRARQEPKNRRCVGVAPIRETDMAAKQKELNDLFLDTLKDIFHAEKQLLRALPKMARAANSDELRQAFETHKDETQVQVERLEQVFETIGKRASGKPCEAMQGLVAEGQEIMEEFKGSDALDAGL